MKVSWPCFPFKVSVFCSHAPEKTKKFCIVQGFRGITVWSIAHVVLFGLGRRVNTILMLAWSTG